MRLFEIQQLDHDYADKSIFRNAALSVKEGEHIGLVGPNGCGKTTFLKILTGETVPDRMRMETDGKLRIGYLEQYAAVSGNATASEYLRENFRALYALDAELRKTYERAAELSGEAQTKTLNRAQRMLEELCAQGFDRIDKKIEEVLFGLGFSETDRRRPAGSLSGGMKTRLLLAKLLLSDHRLLVLDEPTNYLDAGYCDFLADYLGRLESACIVISHDAAFLTKVCGRIVEIANRTFRDYACGYREYLTEKKKRDETQQLQYRVQQTMIAKAEAYIEANSEKAMGGVVRTKATWLKKHLRNLERIEKPDAAAGPRFRFQYRPGATAEILSLRSAEVGYGERGILPPLSLRVLCGEKIVFCGYNGIGKTTLLKTVGGELPPVSGSIDFGERVECVFFKQQDRGQEKDGMTVYRWLRERFPGSTQRKLTEALRACGIGRIQEEGRLCSLSGGELTRLRLCAAMLHPANLLLLDEPTNHLDVVSKQALMQAVASFEGAVLMTTHDSGADLSFATRVIRLEELCD